MAHWERVSVPPDFRGVSRRERQGGSYLRYHPDRLPTTAAPTSAELSELLVDASARVAALGQRLRDRPLPLLYATLLRSESIASSWIEGLHDTPRNVMAARLDDVFGSSGTSQQVVRNIDAMERQVGALIKAQWTHQDVHAVHESLLAHRSDGRYRDRQVYIGGTSPLTAQYVAPPETEVPGYMDDLLRFVNTAGDPPLVKAALVHAQFETIHPYEDGNGRTGRVLFHGVLARAGAIDQGALPLSLVLRDDVDGYIGALTAFRHDGRQPDAAREAFLAYFMESVLRAADLADETINEVVRITERWRPYVARLRTDSTVHQVLDLLTAQPVLTPGYVKTHLGVSAQTAGKALAELENVGIVQRAGGRFRRQQVFQAGEVLALMDRYVPGPPTVRVPETPVEIPVRRYGGPRCARLLPRKGVPCTLPVGHPGPHRAG